MTPLRIDIFSDFVCPWCYLGDARLQRALHTLQTERDLDLTVVYQAYELDPTIPAAGVPYRPWLEAKFGGKAAVDTLLNQMQARGAAENVPYNFDHLTVRPNSRAAHRVIAWMQQNQHDATGLARRLFRAHFNEGIDIGDPQQLAELATPYGADPVAIQTLLAGDQGLAALIDAEHEAQQLGITGVPCFIFNQRLAVSGAQSPAVLLDAMRQALTPP